MTERTDVIELWSEYIGEVFEDDREDKSAITENLKGPPILVEEDLVYVLKNMKKGKAPGSDDVTVEMIIASGEMGIVKLTKLLNAIYQTGIISADMSRSIFVAILKKAGAIECENHRTYESYLMSHVTKVLMRNRWKKKIEMEVSDVQSGFVKNKGTANDIFITRNIIERSLEVQKRVYACFIDYTKAFDKVKHEELINLLRE